MVTNAGIGLPTTTGPVYGGAFVAKINVHESPTSAIIRMTDRMRQIVLDLTNEAMTKIEPSVVEIGTYHGVISLPDENWKT